jgi:acyl-CoA oxidase
MTVQRLLQTIDYENTAGALLPLVAASFVLRATGAALWADYELFEQNRARNDFSTLPELHARSSGLKAITTEATSDGVEGARRACGGHGYSVLSGLPTLYASYVQNVTWEGDNKVMLLQARRYS